MKKMFKCLMFIMCLVALTACGSKDIQSEETQSEEMETVSVYVPVNTEPYEPFYGIWFFASKDAAEAYDAADEAYQNGLVGEVFVTTDWSNLNSERWYVVTAGTYVSESDAQYMLEHVQAVYPDAYIKYSGDWQGESIPSADNGYNSPHNPAFYGIWCFASKDSDEAWDAAVEICENGFEGQMFVTTDWSNLNSEKWYVVTAGTYATEEDAEAMLPYVQYTYPDAYIKYTGNWQG